MLKISNLCVNYGDRKVLDNLNLTVQTGEFVMIVGSNGTGKSTLFNAIAGNVPISGTITFNGKKLDPKTVSIVMQDPKLGTIDHMTIEENLCFALRKGQYRYLMPFHRQRRIALFKEKLSVLSMGLEHRLQDLVAHLSGGQRQALSLIMATLTDAQLLLCDEITAALDPQIAEQIMTLTTELVANSHQTALMITHNMVYASTFGDRIFAMPEFHSFKHNQE